MFDYELPPERIAQRPVEDRASAKMLVAHARGSVSDEHAWDFPEHLEPGDVVIVNDSKVLPCRFFLPRPTTEGEMEILLLRQLTATGSDWECLARPMRRLKAGMVLHLSPNLQAEVLGRAGESEERLLLRLAASGGLSVLSAIEREGSMPIPGYIRQGKSDEADRTRYQTVFSDTLGSVAAPTAGLHFTETILSNIRQRGAGLYTVTLHVGVASFAPVRDLDTHIMPTEWYRIPLRTAQAIHSAKTDGKRVFAVGTTSVRSLESAAKNATLGVSEELQPTTLFITPGFEFSVVDAMLTNFHQPKTTHLLLVSAFFGEERVRRLYEHALQNGYRFLSYGDCMLLLP